MLKMIDDNLLIHGLSKRHETAVQYAVNALKKNYSRNIKKIILFGSCARGEEKYQSDIDLLAVVTEKTSKNTLRQMKNDVISDDYTLPEVNIMTTVSDGPDYLSSEVFNSNIKKDGILLWENV